MNQLKITAYSLIILSLGLVAAKFLLWDYTVSKILPKKKYGVELFISSEGFNEGMNISTFLPESDEHQEISNEISTSPNFTFNIEKNKNGRVASWSNNHVEGKVKLNYAFDYIGKGIQCIIDSTITTELNYPPTFNEYLVGSKHIQVGHPQINQIYLDEIGEEKGTLEVLKKIQNYTNKLKSRPFKGVTDAVTAARLGEASCNGKSRLFIALSRTANIPSRLVGGVILEKGIKKTAHQWVETYINGQWVPFDPLNNHFAYIPHNYLVLYRGDKFLFSHTKNINFDYNFSIKSRLSPNPSLLGELESHPFNAYKLWQVFENIGVSIGLLKLIILLPLGALIVAIFRNVIGLQTFGVFLPALIAIASRETGLFWGLLAFVLVIGVVSLIHFPLEKSGVLYTPKLVIMLTGVVILFLIISFVAIEMNIISLAYITLFPIVVLSISAEKFARTIVENGFEDALWITIQTLIVASVVFLAMNSTSIEAFFLAFPEMFLTIIGVNLLLGKWIGLRMAEYFRFKFFVR